MQQDEQVWQQQLRKYNFQTIFWGIQDITPWGKTFIKARLNDPQWEVAYRDQFAVILTKELQLD